MAGPTQVPFGRLPDFTYGTVTLCGPPFQERFCLSIIFLLPCERPYNPAEKIPAVWAVSRSLAATEEIDFSFSSTGYLDVSVHRVGRLCLCIQHSLIREPRDQHSFDSSPKIFAVFHALHRRLTPRHPPCALNCLTT